MTTIIMFVFGVMVGLTIGFLAAVIGRLQIEVDAARKDGDRR